MAGFPNAESDLLAKRDSIMDSAEHITKYKVISKFEMSVQHAPDAVPQVTMEIPQINLDLAIALARDEPSDDPLKSVRFSLSLSLSIHRDLLAHLALMACVSHTHTHTHTLTHDRRYCSAR